MILTINHGWKLLNIIFLGVFILLIQGCGQMPTADLQNLTLPTSANYYLVCPKGFCNVQPNEYSQVYNVSAEDLFNAWNQVASKQIYMDITGTIPEKAQYEYVQKSIVFGFPDYITVEFIAISNYSSTLAIYSRSRYGFYDFGVNKKRVQKLLGQLNQVVANLPPSNSSTATADSDGKDPAYVKNLDSLIVPNAIPTNNNSAAPATDNSGSTATDNNSAATPATSTDNISGTTTGAATTDNSSNAVPNSTSTDNSNVTTSGGTTPDTGVNTST